MGLDCDGGLCRSPVDEQGTGMGMAISEQTSWPGPHPASPLGTSCLSCVWYPGYFPFLVTRTSGGTAVPWVLVVLGGGRGGLPRSLWRVALCTPRRVLGTQDRMGGGEPRTDDQASSRSETQYRALCSK